MAWDEGQTLDARWEHAREVAGGLHAHWTLGTSYSGFAAALVRESPRLVAGIKAKFREAMLAMGGNIRLLTDLGWEHEERNGMVYLWPLLHRDSPPVVLRLIVLERDKQKVYLLTNVFDPQQLSDEEAGVLYEMRWGIEVFYRSFKQTLHRRRLLSRTPATCLAECTWTMLGLWLLGLLTVTRIVAKKLDPLSWSVALARNAVRRAMRTSVRGGSCRRLTRDLAVAVKDEYKRHGPKAARDYPRKKREKPPGPPKIQSASPKEVQAAKQLRENNRIAA